MQTLLSIVSGVGVFTLIIMALVGILSLVEMFLVKKGNVKILINDEKEVTVPSGGTVLTTLSNEKIFLPSACGGGGTCAMCKCQIFEGGGNILPTETNHINRVEQREHWRLGCQVKVRQDMKIHVPDEIFSIKKFECTVRSNENVATFIKELVLDLPAGEILKFKAGGYIQIYIPPYKIDYAQFKDNVEEEYHEDWNRFDLWRFKASNDEEVFRAYSMANHPAEGNMVMLNVRIASPPPRNPDAPPGIASSYIFNLRPGDKVTVSGPYGEFFIRDTKKEMIYIGGGAGMAPLRAHLFHLFHTLKTRDRKVSFWYGARSVREMFYTDDFRNIEKEYDNFSYHVALSEPMEEDNWTGPVGFIHQVCLDNYLKNHPAPEECEYYMCGPPPMINAVNKMLFDLGVEPDAISYDSFG
ncbi:Na(+)-translocating NADH-quinone reductase subunit F [Planctomycetes bacterium Pan216]|uniref:Na(+)-translocating NADH-quinone reductase subunit F n=2 Tax=Kolteria novifilia TaxID=2527975 RepID=A0A518AYC2_9BACT|nr:Na(+)-translocating NADH-quinone reductase subunit F [Planctomycetes bacterium Pan216]